MMTPRDTTTGRILEDTVIPALIRKNYSYKQQCQIGTRLNGRKHIADLVITNPKTEQTCIVSLKWQQVSGTAEQKIPYEIICLMKSLKDKVINAEKAYIVLGGEGWSLKKFFIEDCLLEYLNYKPQIEIISLDNFISKINQYLL